MKHIKKNFFNLGITSIGILSSLLLLKRNQKPNMLKDIPYFFNGPAPYIFAHRGGMSVRPEQTQLAFDNAVDYGLDGFETDVRLTKDEELIVFHDATVDRTTNGSGKVCDYTLKELKKLDAGFHFTDINGRHIYRGHQQAKILTFGELLEMYPSKYINVDLKDAPSSYEGSIAPKKMYDIIKHHHAEKRVLVTSFYKEQNERFRAISNGEIATGASQHEVTEGVIKFILGLGYHYHPQADTFQMPIKFKGIPLSSTHFIQWLNLLNIVPGYYGINSVDLMYDLYQKGVHTIVTDRPDLGKQFKSLLKQHTSN